MQVSEAGQAKLEEGLADNRYLYKLDHAANYIQVLFLMSEGPLLLFSYERGTPVTAVERIWRMQESQGQIPELDASLVDNRYFYKLDHSANYIQVENQSHH